MSVQEFKNELFFIATTNALKNEFFNDFNVENLKSTLFDSFFELKNYRCKNFRFFAILPSLPKALFLKLEVTKTDFLMYLRCLKYMLEKTFPFFVIIFEFFIFWKTFDLLIQLLQI